MDNKEELIKEIMEKREELRKEQLTRKSKKSETPGMNETEGNEYEMEMETKRGIVEGMRGTIEEIEIEIGARENGGQQEEEEGMYDREDRR